MSTGQGIYSTFPEDMSSNRSNTKHASNSGTESSADGVRVLVVDDERLSAHNLGIQLKFVGESPLFASSENWLRALETNGGQDNLLAVVVGSVSKTELGLLLAELHRECPEHFLLLVRRKEGTLPVFSVSLKERLELLSEAELNYEMLTAALQRAREERGLAPRHLPSRIITPAGSALFRSLSGHSPVIQHIRELIHQVAPRNVPVLILGESGVGKEVVARNLHYHSGRGGQPFIAVNCAAISPDRYGVELFGQAKGPDVPEAVPGLFDRAQGGTLYFDEVGELPLSIQTLLLRFLEDRSFQRTGSAETVSMDVHILAGSNRRLEPAIERGSFRKDLYWRLNLVAIELPPLRQRLEDIPDLVRELLRSLASKDYQPISLNAAAMESLQHHNWPGNVRELANLIERLCIMHEGGVIGLNDLPMEYQHGAATEALLEEIEALANKVEEPVKVSAASGAGAPARVAAAESATVQNGDKDSSTASLDILGRKDASFAMLPLNDKMLRHYLQQFERQMLQTALEDAAQIPSLAAERLGLEEAQFEAKLSACAAG